LDLIHNAIMIDTVTDALDDIGLPTFLS